VNIFGCRSGDHVGYCPGSNSRLWKPVPHRIDAICRLSSRWRCCGSGGALPVVRTKTPAAQQCFGFPETLMASAIKKFLLFNASR
jgi:hypothetical protein